MNIVSFRLDDETFKKVKQEAAKHYPDHKTRVGRMLRKMVYAYLNQPEKVTATSRWPARYELCRKYYSTFYATASPECRFVAHHRGNGESLRGIVKASEGRSKKNRPGPLTLYQVRSIEKMIVETMRAAGMGGDPREVE